MPLTLRPQVAIKIADLGHMAESTEVHKRWVMCLEEELFQQVGGGACMRMQARAAGLKELQPAGIMCQLMMGLAFTMLEHSSWLQGDSEKAAGLPVSPLFDRDKPGVSKSQTGFFGGCGMCYIAESVLLALRHSLLQPQDPSPVCTHPHIPTLRRSTHSPTMPPSLSHLRPPPCT